MKSQTIEQTMEKLPNGTRRLAAQLRTDSSFEAIWAVLTDYNNLSKIIPNLSFSKVVFRQGKTVHLQQIGRQKFLGFNFSAKVLLELLENKDRGTLKFDLLKGDFRCFTGSWNVKNISASNEVSLVYDLTVQGRIGMPVSLIEQRLRQDLSENILAVEKAAMYI